MLVKCPPGNACRLDEINYFDIIHVPRFKKLIKCLPKRIYNDTMRFFISSAEVLQFFFIHRRKQMFLLCLCEASKYWPANDKTFILSLIILFYYWNGKLQPLILRYCSPILPKLFCGPCCSLQPYLLIEFVRRAALHRHVGIAARSGTCTRPARGVYSGYWGRKLNLQEDTAV